MGIFNSIKNAIFGKSEQTHTTSTTGADASAPSVQSRPVVPTPTPGEYSVDVDAVLREKSESHGSSLNWRTSIVDLMKLLGIDSSLENRKELAKELGYSGELNGSAEMNTWLHKAVMRELSEHGGKVPSELLD